MCKKTNICTYLGKRWMMRHLMFSCHILRTCGRCEPHFVSIVHLKWNVIFHLNSYGVLEIRIHKQHLYSDGWWKSCEMEISGCCYCLVRIILDTVCYLTVGVEYWCSCLVASFSASSSSSTLPVWPSTDCLAPFRRGQLTLSAAALPQL